MNNRAFTLFPKLPPELRLLIWEEAALVPRIWGISPNTYPEYLQSVSGDAATPCYKASMFGHLFEQVSPLFLASRESREVAIRCYRFYLQLHGGHYLLSETDIFIRSLFLDQQSGSDPFEPVTTTINFHTTESGKKVCIEQGFFDRRAVPDNPVTKLAALIDVNWIRQLATDCVQRTTIGFWIYTLRNRKRGHSKALVDNEMQSGSGRHEHDAGSEAEYDIYEDAIIAMDLTVVED